MILVCLLGLLRRCAPRNDSTGNIHCWLGCAVKNSWMYCHCEERSDEAIRFPHQFCY